MALELARFALGFGVVALLWVGIVALWAHQAGKVRRVAAALGLQEAGDSTRWHPRAEGLVAGRPVHVAMTWHLKERFLVLTTPCAMPPGFVLVVGDDAPARRSGIRLRGLREVKTGWKGFDGWAWPRSSGTALATAMLRRCRPALNAAPTTLFFHEGRASLAKNLMQVRAADAPKLARALLRRADDLAACARDPQALAAAQQPERTPEAWGPGEDEAPELIA